MLRTSTKGAKYITF